MKALSFALVFLLLGGAAAGQDQLQMDPEVRQWFRNPDGSCVQCSIGMCGIWQNTPAATTLLWDTEYGSKVRGGSWPGRVEEYCDRRKIAAWSITGSSTFDWIRWASKTGRMTAIGAGRSHFQTHFYYDPVKDRYYVCNNNSPKVIDEYTPEEFRRLHLASGTWIVCLKTPSPPHYPKYVQWW